MFQFCTKKESCQVVISEIINKCADLFYINRDLITSKSRMRTAVKARQALAMALSIRGHSTSAIGRWLDRDHTTIMHNLGMAKEIMSRDSLFGEKVFILAQMVHQPVNLHPQRHKQVAKLDLGNKTIVLDDFNEEEVEKEKELKYSGPQAWGCDSGVPTHNNLNRSLRHASEKLLDAIRRERANAAAY